jgi:hypothetical protein
MIPNQDFRLLVNGTDANGFRYQRVVERLFIEIER